QNQTMQLMIPIGRIGALWEYLLIAARDRFRRQLPSNRQSLPCKRHRHARPGRAWQLALKLRQKAVNLAQLVFDTRGQLVALLPMLEGVQALGVDAPSGV